MSLLHFKGKSVIRNHHHTVKFHELVAVPGKGLTREPSLDDNLVVRGDNLVALKALLPTYAGKVKCIYIDPPYNTGNERWVYNDNVSSPMIREWIGKEVGRDDLSRHDKWCAMMYPRLVLLRELLADDGAIFVSIDDHEQHRLRMIMDEVFGERNFVTNIVWQKKYSTQNDASSFSDMHDFVVAYAKRRDAPGEAGGWRVNLLRRGEKQNARYRNPDNDPRGPWKPGDMLVKTYAAAYDYEIETPSGRKVRPPEGRCWRYSREKYRSMVEDNRVWFGVGGNSIPAVKRFLAEVRDGLVPPTLWLRDDVGDNQEAANEIKELFGRVAFETPKPVRLIRRILELATNDGDIVLDSFAGTGTTAHAVLDLNREGAGRRRFILVECQDYADGLTAERVRRVIRGVGNARDERLREGLGGTFSFYELGRPIDIDAMLDGDELPSYANLAHYAFYTATGETFDPRRVDEPSSYIGSSSTYEVFLLYAPDAEKLRDMALNLDFAERIEARFPGRPKLVFAPACFLEEFDLRDRNIRFAQLPFEIYRLAA